jgi:hypothetical protein
MRQGSLLLPFAITDNTLIQPWGARPLITPSTTDPIVIVTFPTFDYQVVFPEIKHNPIRFRFYYIIKLYFNFSQIREFSSLDSETQQYLEDIIDGGVTHV